MSTHQAATLRDERRRTHAGGIPAPRRILGIVSGKGGVGKSALAVNLGVACAAAGARTLLVDGDAGLANADLLLGLLPRYELSDWCANRVELSEVLCRDQGGLDLIVSGPGREPARRVAQAAAGYEASGLGTLFDERDLTILDLGAGIGNAVIDLAIECDPVWLVVTPEPTSLADAYTMARRLWERRPGLRIELIVNRAPDSDTGERTHQALQRLSRRFLDRGLDLRGVLHEDAAMLRAVARQRPVVLSEPSSGISRRLCLLAESLLEDVGSARRSPPPTWPDSGRLPA